MGELVVNFSTLDLLTMNIDATVQQMNNRINDIGTMAGRISGVSTRRGYLDSAVSQLYGRQNDIGDKIDKLTTFRSDLVDFGQEAQQADQRVASRISYSTGSFCYTQGISMAEAAGNWWQSVLEEAKDWFMNTPLGKGIQAVADWYEANKETIWAGIELLVDGAICVLAVAAFVALFPTSLAALGFWGTVSLIAAGFTAAKAVADLFSQSASFTSHLLGDHEAGREWASRGLDDYMTGAGRFVDDVAGTGDFWENCMSFTYTGLEIVSITNAVNDVRSIGTKVMDAFKGGRFSFDTIRTIMGNDKLSVRDFMRSSDSPIRSVDDLFLAGDGFMDNQRALKSVCDGYRYTINMGWSIFDSDPYTNPFTEMKFGSKYDEILYRGGELYVDTRFGSGTYNSLHLNEVTTIMDPLKTPEIKTEAFKDLLTGLGYLEADEAA